MRFPLIEVDSVTAATEALREHGDDAVVVAGSTAITLMLGRRLLDPSALISIGRIADEELHGADVTDGVLTLGGLMTLAAVERDPVVRGALPALAEVFGTVGNIRVRHAATVGGVVAEADYASDPPCALLALDAEVVVMNVDGVRIVPLADFILGFYETALEPDEIVIAVQLPVPPAHVGAAYEKFRTRSSEDRPCVGVFALAEVAGDGTCEELRLAVGAASETPERFDDLEAEVRGRVLDAALADEIAAAYADRIDTLDDMRGSAAYRSQMVRVLARRTMLSAVARAGRS